MSDIQQYVCTPQGPYPVTADEIDGQPGLVYYADHLAAVAAAAVPTGVWEEDSFDSGVKAAREAVVEVSQHDHPDIDPLEFSTPFDYAKAICEAAIDALQPRDEGRNTG